MVVADPRSATAGSRRGRPPTAPGRGRPIGTSRRGRPPGTSRRKLELIALRLFTEQGFDETPIEQIAAEAGVSRRTFFRYFSSKTSVLWGEFDAEVEAIRAALAAVPATVPMMDAIRRAVVAANHYRAEDVSELRARMNLIISVPALQASAAVRYDAWERAISDFAATRIGQPAGSLYPLAVGRATLAVCRAAYDRWCARADADLTVYLDAAVAALAAGFQPASLGTEEQVVSRRARSM
jgi:mycofactocin system transcriptional regulator